MLSVGFAASLLILSLCAGPALSQGGDCVGGITDCTNTFTTVLVEHAASNPGLMCGDLDNFIQCVMGLDCPMTEAQKQQLISQSRSQVADAGLNCDTNTGGAGGGPTIPTACAESINACNGDIMAVLEGGNLPKLEEFCSKLDTYATCMTNLGASCEMSQQQKDAMVGQMTMRMKANGLDCAAISGSGGSGGSGMTAQMKMYKVVQLFSQHGCGDIVSNCSDQYAVQANTNKAPACSDVKKSGQCMFNKCADIKGTGDEDEAAKLLVEFAKAEFNCQFTASEVTDNGSNGMHQPIMASLLMCVMAAVMKKMLLL